MVSDEFSGPPEVSGIVTLDGVPLAAVTVSFENSDGRPFHVVTDSTGRYEFQGESATPPPGKYLVRVTGSPDSGTVEENSTQQSLPARYNTATELIVDVLPGRNSTNFPLLSDSGSELPEL